MEWKKSPAELIEMFEQVVPDDPSVEKRKMFGYPSAFLNGHMFMGLYQDRLFLRLSDSDRQHFLEIPGAAIFEPMAGRPMKEYVVTPPAMMQDHATLQDWSQRSLAFARGLAPKDGTKKVRSTKNSRSKKT